MVAAASVIPDRLRAAEHDWTGAWESVERARAAATQAGFEEYVFDARLQRARLELSSGKRAVARAQLETLIKDAQREGFGVVARDAQSTLDTIRG
jgi:hypothetical protein